MPLRQRAKTPPALPQGGAKVIVAGGRDDAGELKGITMTQHNHQTAPTEFAEADGIRFAYRRFGAGSHTNIPNCSSVTSRRSFPPSILGHRECETLQTA